MTMGSTRESFNLFNKYGFQYFWRAMRQRRFKQLRQYVFRDTCTHWICWLSGGHEFYSAWDPEIEMDDMYCHWCHRWKESE